MKKLITDKLNELKSKLAEAKQPKMGKRMVNYEDTILKLEIQIEVLGDFLQFVVTVEDELEAKYDNPEDLMLLKKKKEAMLDAMDSYVEFLVEIDEKT